MIPFFKSTTAKANPVVSSAAFAALVALLLAGLTGCAATPQGSAPGTAVMLVQVLKEKQPKRIVISLRSDAAPATVDNFRELVSRHYYDGMRFHRLFPHTLVQTGDPKSRRGQTERSGTGGPGYTLPAEIRLKTTRGAVVAARLPDEINPVRASNGSQFFVCLRALPQFDGKYTVFGEVTEGLTDLEAISTLPVDSNDFPTERIIIRSIRLQ